MQLEEYFLPYQLKWLNDDSKIKIWEKSRRIGATYIQAYEDVRDCVYKKVPAVWFSSADESAAREYIEYCEKWTTMFNTAAKSLGLVIIDKEKDIKALVIEFSNGTKIHALSSNPKGFRSKGGKVVLDEFAHHDKPEELWAAARPCITWGYPLRILSTHNGQSTLFFKLINDIEKGNLKWSLHSTSIHLASEEGLVNKIYGRKTSIEEQEEWIEEQRKNCFDDYTWRQEYCCEAVDEACAFLPYDLIASCELNDLYRELDCLQGDLYVGMDVARRHDLSVIWVLEKLGNVKYTRMIKVMPKTPFNIQEDILYSILEYPNVRRLCIDESHMGMPVAEEAQRKFSNYKVENISFTVPNKESLAYNLRINFENKTVYIPPENEIREDLHSVRRLTSSTGHLRFDAKRTQNAGHADRFWALALALQAAQVDDSELYVATRRRWKSNDITKNCY